MRKARYFLTLTLVVGQVYAEWIPHSDSKIRDVEYYIEYPVDASDTYFKEFKALSNFPDSPKGPIKSLVYNYKVNCQNLRIQTKGLELFYGPMATGNKVGPIIPANNEHQWRQIKFLKQERLAREICKKNNTLDIPKNRLEKILKTG